MKILLLLTLLLPNISTFLYAKSGMEDIREYKNAVEQAFILRDTENLPKYLQALSTLILEGKVEGKVDPKEPEMQYWGRPLPKQIESRVCKFRPAREGEKEEIYKALETLAIVNVYLSTVYEHPLFSLPGDTPHQKIAIEHYQKVVTRENFGKKNKLFSATSSLLGDIFKKSYDNASPVDFENSTYKGQVNLQKPQTQKWKRDHQREHNWILGFKVHREDREDKEGHLAQNYAELLTPDPEVLKMGSASSVHAALATAQVISTLQELNDYLRGKSTLFNDAPELYSFPEYASEGNIIRQLFSTLNGISNTADSEEVFVATIVALDGINHFAGALLNALIKNNTFSGKKDWESYRKYQIEKYIQRVEKRIYDGAKEILERMNGSIPSYKLKGISTTVQLANYILGSMSKPPLLTQDAVIAALCYIHSNKPEAITEATAKQPLFTDCRSIQDILQKISFIYTEAQTVQGIIDLTVPKLYHKKIGQPQTFSGLTSAAMRLLESQNPESQNIDDWETAQGILEEMVTKSTGPQTIDRFLETTGLQIFDHLGLPHQNHHQLMNSLSQKIRSIRAMHEVLEVMLPLYPTKFRPFRTYSEWKDAIVIIREITSNFARQLAVNRILATARLPLFDEAGLLYQNCDQLIGSLETEEKAN